MNDLETKDGATAGVSPPLGFVVFACSLQLTVRASKNNF
jgi:hypothetical protein